MSTKIYPIGIQNFEKIRNDGYLYIDKTALMYQMVKTGSYYFLSRPRRFGKSLSNTGSRSGRDYSGMSSIEDCCRTFRDGYSSGLERAD